MSEPTAPASAVPADPAMINCRIRTLLGGGPLTEAGRAEYGRLLVEWEAAARAGQELAA